MNRLLQFLALAALANLPIGAAEESVAPLQMSNAELYTVLAYYQRVAGRAVFVSPHVDCRQRVGIESPEAITKEQGLQLVRATLLVKYEILIRDTKTGETLVESAAPRRVQERRVRNPEEPESRTNVEFPNTDLRDVLVFYEMRSGQSVFAAINLGFPAVTISSKEPLARAQVIPFIRDALGENYGFETRTLRSGEVVVKKGAPPLRPQAEPAVPAGRVRVRSISR
jgi:hypothetical protein